MILLRQSTASQEIPLGQFVDDLDGKTAETALSIANTDIKLWKAGATTLANKNSGGATHISGGIYYAVLDATDTDTLGSLQVFVSVSGALPERQECAVLPANVYDAIVAGSDKLQVDTVEIGGTSQTARDIGASVLVSSGTGAGQISLSSGTVTVGAMANNTLTAAAVAADAVSELQSGLSTLDAAGVRSAVGLASANLDTQIDAVPTANENADALLDRSAGVETGWTIRQAMRIMLATLAGKVSGAGTTTVAIRDMADSKDRISATVDADGNRSAVTRDAT